MSPTSCKSEQPPPRLHGVVADFTQCTDQEWTTGEEVETDDEDAVTSASATGDRDEVRPEHRAHRWQHCYPNLPGYYKCARRLIRGGKSRHSCVSAKRWTRRPTPPLTCTHCVCGRTHWSSSSSPGSRPGLMCPDTAAHADECHWESAGGRQLHKSTRPEEVTSPPRPADQTVARPETAGGQSSALTIGTSETMESVTSMGAANTAGDGDEVPQNSAPSTAKEESLHDGASTHSDASTESHEGLLLDLWCMGFTHTGAGEQCSEWHISLLHHGFRRQRRQAVDAEGRCRNADPLPGMFACHRWKVRRRTYSNLFRHQA